MRTLQIDEKQFAATLGIKARQYEGFTYDRDRQNTIDGHVRRLLIFEGDRDCYVAVKEASNEFEHGYASFFEMYDKGEPMRDRTARHVRKAILDLIDIAEGTRATLLVPPYDEPVPWPKSRRFRARIAGLGIRHASDYPHLRWTRPLEAFFRMADDNYKVLAPDRFPSSVQDELGGVTVLAQQITDESS